jgi:CheY-like chemotaxis protein
MQRPRAEASSMSKVIEADFLPRNLEAGSTWLSFIGRPSFKAARRILVVDNDLYTTRLIKILLEKKGNYCVLPENDPARAHQTARDFRPDVILLDIVMPEIDGGEVAARLGNDPELCRTPIIFLTALVTEAEAKSGLKIDGHSFLAKPINISELVGAIEQHLPHARTAINEK